MSSKLLEINLISADLPEVSKMLRTFAVAYMTPDHKLTTKTDHRGHTNPSWNYKMLFHVDRDFLKHHSSALTIEIYNLASLRDLPIATARLQFNSLTPLLTPNGAYRRLSLQMARPSGDLQGTVHLGIQLVDMDDDVSLSSLRITDEEKPTPTITDGLVEKPEINGLGPDEKPGPEIEPSMCSTPESKYTWRPESEAAETRTMTSVYSAMRSLPSEVAAGLKKGIYTAEYGSSIFENWTEGGDKSEFLGMSDDGEWDATAAEAEAETETETKKVVPLTSEMAIDYQPKKPLVKPNGLMKCFSSMYGFEFTFSCGSNQFKLKKKIKGLNRVRHHRSYSDGSLGRFYR